ncbi:MULTISPECIES: NAD kinase [Bacillus]|uniref:NAD kinase n=1 Tax=Bacillus TaxID=1386 RepID=UPI00031BCED3|nr:MULTISPECIES: NAD kinase [Bacillus]
MTNRRNVFFFHNNTQDIPDILKTAENLASEYNFYIVDDVKKANIIVSIGDDGAFLQAVRKTGFRNDCLYAGISTTGNLNMYCDFSIKERDKMIEAITDELIEVRKYPVIEVSLDEQPVFYCLNELSIRSSIIKTFVLDVYIDDLHFETFRGDGMVISTPTGSTAYNKSMSGAVVDPMLPCFQVSELASLNNNIYRTLSSPFILSGDRKLTLRVTDINNAFPIIGMDNEALSIANTKKIEISLSDRVIKTVKLKDNSFWEKVQRAFL